MPSRVRARAQLAPPSRKVDHPVDFDRYPPNYGAAAGTRIRYSSIEAAVSDYGATIDRIGPECGAAVTLRIDGTAAAFEDRGLPLSAMAQRYHAYTLSPDAPGGLPAGWSLELSRVAPAFGRDGGAIQARFFDDTGKEVPVTDLRDLGIVTK
jgi:hypothetical protein